jgi:hypothetical protein
VFRPPAAARRIGDATAPVAYHSAALRASRSMGGDRNGVTWEEAEAGVRQRKGGTVAAGAGFAEGMGEFVLSSMDERFSRSAYIDELLASSRQPGSWDCLVLFCAWRASECASISIFTFQP